MAVDLSTELAKSAPDVHALTVLAERALNEGDLAGAIEVASRALSMLGVRVPTASVQTTRQLVWQLLVQVTHTVGPWWFVTRSSPESDDAPAAARLLGLLSTAFSRSGHAARSLWANVYDVNLIERSAAANSRERAYTDHASLLTAFAWFKRANTYAKRASSQLATPTYDAESVVLGETARFPEGLEASRSAVATAARHNNLRLANLARYRLAITYWRLGVIPDAIAEAKATYHEGGEFCGKHAFGNGLDVWTIASNGQIPGEVIARELRRPCQDVVTSVQLQLAVGVWNLFHNHIAESIEALERACSFARRARAAAPMLGTCQAWLASALCRLAGEQKPDDAQLRRALTHRADRAARCALRTSRTFRAALPHALRECAIVSALRGCETRSRRLFAESLAVADEQHAAHEYATTLSERGRIGLPLGWEEADADVADGQFVSSALRRAPVLRDIWKDAPTPVYPPESETAGTG